MLRHSTWRYFNSVETHDLKVCCQLVKCFVMLWS